MRHIAQPFEERTHLVGAVHIHAVAEIRLDGIEDDQLRASLSHRLLQARIAEGERLPAFVDHQHTGAVRAGGDKPGLDRVGKSVLCGLVDHAHRFCCHAAGERVSARQRRNEREGEGGFALAGITLHEGQLAQRNVGVPEPFDFLNRNLFHGDQLQFRFHTSTSFLCFPRRGGGRSHSAVGLPSHKQERLVVFNSNTSFIIINRAHKKWVQFLYLL